MENCCTSGAGKSSFIEKLGLHILGKDADGNDTRYVSYSPVLVIAIELVSVLSLVVFPTVNLPPVVFPFFMVYRLESSTPSSSESNESPSCKPSRNVKLHYPSKLSVVCIDPSSSRSGGSILGDKTRMEQLSRHDRAFVRPSPSRGTLGGLADYTNDVVMLYQLADYHLVIVETVGLGQSEVDVDNTVDMSILLLAPGAGDELQGVKKVSTCIITEAGRPIVLQSNDEKSNVAFSSPSASPL